jgi:hypothetical protein
LSPLPTPTALGAKKLGDGTFAVERPKLEALGVYLSEIQKWISEARVCLEAGARIPVIHGGGSGATSHVIPGDGIGAYDDPRTR